MNMRFNFNKFNNQIHPLLDELAEKSKETREVFGKIEYDFDAIKILLYLFKNMQIAMTSAGFVEIYKKREGIKITVRFINKRLKKFQDSGLVIRGDECEWQLTQHGVDLARLILESLNKELNYVLNQI